MFHASAQKVSITILQGFHILANLKKDEKSLAKKRIEPHDDDDWL